MNEPGNAAMRSGADQPRRKLSADSALVAAYREGLVLAAVLVIGGSSAIRIVAAEHGGAAALEPGEIVKARWWCRRASHAECVAAAARSPHRVKDKSADAAARACDAIIRAASRLAIALHSDEEISAEATQVIARLDDEIEKQKQSGALKSINTAYRQYRLEASARGEPILRYAQWMDRYKAKLIREIAANLR